MSLTAEQVQHIEQSWAAWYVDAMRVHSLAQELNSFAISEADWRHQSADVMSRMNANQIERRTYVEQVCGIQWFDKSYGQDTWNLIHLHPNNHTTKDPSLYLSRPPKKKPP